MSEQRDEKAIFNAARKIDSSTERDDYLKQACEDQDQLDRIARLLHVHDEEQSFLESPPAGVAVTIDLPEVTETPGTVIDRYKLLQEIREA